MTAREKNATVVFKAARMARLIIDLGQQISLRPLIPHSYFAAWCGQ
jgi:hypothetical protein